jgi:choline dehydrogenase-like flavoprotein
MMYTRASASDYDDWKTVYENPGWGSDDLIPLLRKVGALGLTLGFLFVLMLLWP